MKECPWVQHLTSFQKRGVGALLSVFAFNYERVPMSCLQQLDASDLMPLKANNRTNNVEQGCQWLRSQVTMAQSLACGVCHISYVCLCKSAL